MCARHRLWHWRYSGEQDGKQPTSKIWHVNGRKTGVGMALLLSTLEQLAWGISTLHPHSLELCGCREHRTQRNDASTGVLSNNPNKLKSMATPGHFGPLMPAGRKAKQLPRWQQCIHFSIDGNLGCFQLLVTLDKAARKLLAQDFLVNLCFYFSSVNT